MEIDKQKFGEPLHDFTLQQVGGGEVNLAAQLHGKKGGVVVFWSGTCSHCVRYDKYLNAFAQSHPDFAFVAVASRHGETPDGIRKSITERKLEFPILHDPGSTVAKQWFTQQTPRVFLMDADRKLLYRGALDNFKYPDDPEFLNYLEPAISQFQSGQAIAKPETASFGCAIMSVYYILPKAL
ncbi:MAG: redoxin family protein [Bryobacteraceae bacterium]